MKKPIALLLIALFLCGCPTVKPPQRPVAYMYPTVMPMSALEACQPKAVSAQEVRGLLEKAKVLSLLEAEGLLTGDVDIMVRGLTKRGYAELDARRTSGNLQWVAVMSLEQGCLLLCGFKKMPPKECRFGAEINDKMARNYLEPDAYGRAKQVTEYATQTPGVVLRRIQLGKNTHWELRVLLSL